MSDTIMGTPDSESNYTPSSKVRICAPDKYYGDRNKLKAWLLQMDRHFHVEGDRVPDEDKVMIATTYMKDQAELWVTPHLERYLDDEITDNENARLMENWDLFKIKLKQTFSPIKASVIAERKIQTLRQTHSVADYTALFQRYQAQINWDDTALIRMFKQGLKEQVRAELMRTNARTDSLDELINETIRLDNELYELQLEARAYKPEYVSKKKERQTSNRYGNQRGSHRPHGHGKARMPGVYGSEDYENMHVDNVEHGPRRNSSAKYHGKGKPDNGKETRTCYNCNKPGHLSAKCRQPKKNTVSRYVNMIESGEPDEGDDWEIVGSFVGPYSDNEETRQMITKIQEEFIRDGTIRSHDQTTIMSRKAPASRKNQSGPLIVRSPTPHPGQKIHTAWDEEAEDDETPSSPPYYQDNTGQVFVTPPDSPVLGRKAASRSQKKRASTSRKGKSGPRHEGDAVYVNDHQGVALYEEDTVRSAQEARQTMSTPEYENWVDKSTREFAIRQTSFPKHTKAASVYAMDPRNPLHQQMSWTACRDDSCHIHYDDKSLAGWFPEPTGECRWTAYDCTKHTCPRHLWVKRETGIFPGLDEEQSSVNQVLVNNRCSNDDWQLCLRHQCTRHQEVKKINGFNRLPEPFLGKRLPARSLDPRAAMRSTQLPSTSSQ
jgi:hypothetical protein